MDRDEHIAEILGTWQECREQGESIEPEALIAAHPELAHDLAQRLAALGYLDLALADASHPSVAVPSQIGDFRIVREIGRGGMGVVYEAEQISMRRRVALKVLSLAITGTPQAAKRFRREAQATGRLHHTNIVPIYGLGQHGSHWYYAMELVEGRPLSEVIGAMRGAPPTEERLARHAASAPTSELVPDTGTGTRAYFIRVAEMFAGVADALHLAHQERVIHRDVKPSNLLLDADGTLKIVDFGLALVADDGPPMTISGDLLGTPAYMSPEQAMAKRIHIDHRTDVYSLAATLYEVLTLAPPFAAGSLHELCSQIAAKDPELPRRRDVRIPPDLETIVLKAMEKDRERRYQSAGELARDLRRFAEGVPIHARRVGPVTRTWKRIKRHKVRASLVVGVAVVLVACVVFARRAAVEAEHSQALEYDRLVERAKRAAAQRELFWDPVEHLVYFPNLGVASQTLTDAIALDATRSEAYLLRAFLGARTDPSNPAEKLHRSLADLEHALARGLAPRTYHFARAHILGVGARWEESADAERAAGSPVEALDHYCLARIRDRSGRRDEALALLARGLELSGPGDWVRRITLRARHKLRWLNNDSFGALQDLLALQEYGETDVGTRIAVAYCCRRLGQDQRARARFEELVDDTRAAGTEAAWCELCAACALYRVPPDWWLGVTEEAVGAWPDSAPLWLHRAFALGSGDESLEACRRALDLMPSDAGCHQRYAECLWQSGRKQEALREYDEVLELAPDAVRPRLLRAMIRADFGRFEEALDDLNAALRRQPWNVWAHHTKSRCLRDNRDRLAAISEAIRLAPTNGHFHASRAHLHIEAGQPQEALRDARRAVELKPEAGGLFLAGAALLRLGEPKEALQCLRRATELRPGSAKFHSVAALALLELNSFGEALGSALKAVELDDRSADAHAAAARAYAGLDDLERALEHSNRALALGFDDAQKAEHAVTVNAGLLNGLAWKAATGDAPDATRAVEYARRAAEFSRSDAAIQNTLGVALYRNGDWADSLEALERSVDGNGGSAYDWFFIAMAKHKLGQKDAHDSYERAVAWMEEHKPDDEELKRFRAEAEEVLGITDGE
ncbi:MAG: protein kinase domain-containing protein [Planctomycetota bacterium]|jgi:serine/threonine protein kinase/tetratricopeptide (TPR) repeat protein